MRLPPLFFCPPLLALSLATACAEPAPSPDTAQATEAAQPSTGTASVRTNPIEDTAVDASRRIAAARVSSAAQEAAQRSPVPVLLPDDDDLLAAAILTVGDTWYAASIPGDGFVIALQGTHAVHEMPGMGQKEASEAQPDQGTSAEPVLSRTHGIVHIAFQEFGASYTISIDCERPMENPRCAEDDFVLSLHESAAILEVPQ